MGLKNKTSIFDLVAGNESVENMNTQQGPSFQQPTDVASQVHIDSLQIVPGGVQNSPHQDLNGLPDPDFNTLNGTSDSPFSTPNSFTSTGDHMVDLLTQNVISTNTGQAYDPSPNQSPFQDLNGQPGPQFDLGTDSTLQTDNLVNLTPQLDYPDLNGVEGGNGFFHGINNPGMGQGLQLDGMSLHERLLTNNYSYQHGNSQANIQPGTFDLNGTTPTQYIDNMPD